MSLCCDCSRPDYNAWNQVSASSIGHSVLYEKVEEKNKVNGTFSKLLAMHPAYDSTITALRLAAALIGYSCLSPGLHVKRPPYTKVLSCPFISYLTHGIKERN